MTTTVVVVVFVVATKWKINFYLSTNNLISITANYLVPINITHGLRLLSRKVNYERKPWWHKKGTWFYCWSEQKLKQRLILSIIQKNTQDSSPLAIPSEVGRNLGNNWKIATFLGFTFQGRKKDPAFLALLPCFCILIARISATKP